MLAVLLRQMQITDVRDKSETGYGVAQLMPAVMNSAARSDRRTFFREDLCAEMVDLLLLCVGMRNR